MKKHDNRFPDFLFSLLLFVEISFFVSGYRLRRSQESCW